MLKVGDRGDKVEALQKKLVVLGYFLQPDKVFGPFTKVAVQAVQRLAKIKRDGIVGPSTERVIKEQISKAKNPNISLAGLVFVDANNISGLYPYSPGPNSGPVRRGKWGAKKTKNILKKVGTALSDCGLETGLGDISLKNGGPYFSIKIPTKLVHQSHQKGSDVDLRAIRKDGRRAGVKWNLTTYDRKATDLLVRAMRENGAKLILFNDPKLTKKYNFVKECPGHSDHLHGIF